MKLPELLKKLETSSVIGFEEINFKDGFVLAYYNSSDHPGLYLNVYRSKSRSFDNRCEKIFISSRNEKEILKLIKQTKLRYERYSSFMKSIGFETYGNGLYFGELNTISKGKLKLTFSFRFGDKKICKVENGWNIKPSHYAFPDNIKCETDDFEGFVLWYLKTHLSMEEQIKLPFEVRDKLMERDFHELE